MYIYICIFRDTYIHVHVGVYTWTPTRSLRTLRTPHTLRTLRSMLRRFVVQDGPWRLQWPSAASSRMVDLWDLSGFFKDVVGTILQFHSFLFETWTCFFLAPFILGIIMPAKILWACQMGLSHGLRLSDVQDMFEVYVAGIRSVRAWAPEPLLVSGSSWDHLVHWDLEVESMLGVSFCGGPWRTRDVWRFAPPVHKKENPHGDPLATWESPSRKQG